nr:immunoglobulin heavy chain junction region [Mus musculus]
LCERLLWLRRGRLL